MNDIYPPGMFRNLKFEINEGERIDAAIYKYKPGNFWVLNYTRRKRGNLAEDQLPHSHKFETRKRALSYLRLVVLSDRNPDVWKVTKKVKSAINTQRAFEGIGMSPEHAKRAAESWDKAHPNYSKMSKP